MITIKDVAKHAGVSVTTTSYALNNMGTISEATRKRVRDSAEELNYHPNAFARNLKKQKTLTIGVFISRFGGSFYEVVVVSLNELSRPLPRLCTGELRPLHVRLLYPRVSRFCIYSAKMDTWSPHTDRLSKCRGLWTTNEDLIHVCLYSFQ